jgi:hypothetical protein
MSLAQLSQLLPLPEEELHQVLEYASTLPKTDAAEHFRNLLGDSPQAIEFIATFNARRPAPPTADSSVEPVPKSSRGPKKKKPPLHTPAPRRVEDFGPALGLSAYNKRDLDNDYITKRSTPPPPAQEASGSAAPPQQQRTAAGYLISDTVPKSKPKSNPVSRSSTPKPPTKVNFTGGTPMAGASTAIADLDAAIRTLELTTNPTRADDVEARRCNCIASRHPLQTAAPNCLSCGKVICVKEGLGPCTFCGTPLLTSDQVQGMIRELKADRGRERMAADKEAHRKPEVSKTPAPFSNRKAAGAEEEQKKQQLSDAEAKALEHRDKLLGFQAQNARRTTVRDEAADFDASEAIMGTGGSMWASPEERAKELKRQQKILREMEWNARPEYEKRRQVVSIDLVGGKVVKKMAAVERAPSPDPEPVNAGSSGVETSRSSRALAQVAGNKGTGHAGGAFSENPLLGGLIKPVFDVKGKGTENLEGRKDRKSQWRRVQDEVDNEGVILDGGVQGHVSIPTAGAGDEPACG